MLGQDFLTMLAMLRWPAFELRLNAVEVPKGAGLTQPAVAGVGVFGHETAGLIGGIRQEGFGLVGQYRYRCEAERPQFVECVADG